MSQEPTPVDAVLAHYVSIIDYLRDNDEISLQIEAESNLRKVLVVSAASYFEDQVKLHLREFIAECSQGNARIVNIFDDKIVERQYHTLFDWKGTKANTFYGMFGQEFAEMMKRIVRESELIDSQVRAFLELGLLRNQMVHQNFASYYFDKTMEEIIASYQLGRQFVDSLPIWLRQSDGDGI